MCSNFIHAELTKTKHVHYYCFSLTASVSRVTDVVTTSAQLLYRCISICYTTVVTGYVTFDELISLMNMLHKSATGQVVKGLRELDLAVDGKFTYATFLDLDKR